MTWHWLPQPAKARMGSDGFFTYRVRMGHHPYRHVRKAWWGRTWQTEWTDCVLAARGWTERGSRRKARRWRKRSLKARVRRARQHMWVRVHITERERHAS
jgi:hypothetical protein